MRTEPDLRRCETLSTYQTPNPEQAWPAPDDTNRKGNRVKKAAIVGARKAGLVDAPDPTPKGDWVVVKVHAAPMCTEYKSFVAGECSAYLGHEAVGEVVAIDGPGTVNLADRVVVMPQYPCGRCELCRAGDYIYCEHNYDVADFTGSPEGGATMAQYVLKPSWLLMPIPDGVSYAHASLALCALGPSFGGLQAMGATAFDTVLITGAGPVGTGAVVNALFRRARPIVVESVPERVARAREMGVEAVIDPDDPDAVEHIRELTDGRGVDCALECSGVPQAQRLCIDAARRCGRVAFIGECGDELTIRVSPDMLSKGLTIRGSWHYNLNDFPSIMQVITRSPLIDRLISGVLPMSDIQTAFEMSASRTAAKIILKPWE